MAALLTAMLTNFFRPLFAPLDAELAALIAPGGAYASVKASLLRHGYLRAAAYVLAAAVANHVRRLLTPWLGACLWRHALADMKTARSSPHGFLEAALGRCSGGGALLPVVGAWACQLALVGVLRRLLLERLAADGQRRRGDAGKSSVRDDDRGKRRAEVLLEAYRVLFLALAFALLESAYTETCWAAATTYAVGALLRGSGPERAFLNALIRSRWPVAVLQACLVGGWLWTVCLPTAARCGRALARGDVYTPAATYWLWAGTLLLVRRSNKYFVLLEMSDMLVTFGWAALGAAVVLVWAVQGVAERDEARRLGRHGAAAGRRL